MEFGIFIPAHVPAARLEATADAEHEAIIHETNLVRVAGPSAQEVLLGRRAPRPHPVPHLSDRASYLGDREQAAVPAAT